MKGAALFLLALLASPPAWGAEAALDLGPQAIRRGEAIFRENCQECHGAKYLGLAPRMSAADSAEAFGRPVPDLSLVAAMKGRGKKGARFVAAFLLGYREDGGNSVAPGTAMPPVLDPSDPATPRKAADVAAFLYYAADPSFRERERLGVYVLCYMAVLVALLYLLYRRTWRSLENPAQGGRTARPR
ncbi:MAG: hypothetical protein HY900_15715 [Deltaproteobacteria bacterium]|nr:hypothetical protein [Deltaproteobacteria bacterium]